MNTVTELLDQLRAEFDVNVKAQEDLRGLLDFKKLQRICEKRWGIVINDGAMAHIWTPQLLADYIDARLDLSRPRPLG